MGGLGATYLGGRLPGFFGSVASLSGFVDPQWQAALIQQEMGLFSFATENGDDDSDPVYRPSDGFYADGHNPALLVKNLQYTRLFLSTGTGVPSKADPDPTPADILDEHIIDAMNPLNHEAVEAAGMHATYQVHRGAHDGPDFLLEVEAMLKWGLFKPVVADPASWTNKTVATSGQLWDFNYRFAAPPTQVVRFEQSGTTLSISAAGSPVTIRRPMVVRSTPPPRPRCACRTATRSPPSFPTGSATAPVGDERAPVRAERAGRTRPRR